MSRYVCLSLIRLLRRMIRTYCIHSVVCTGSRGEDPTCTAPPREHVLPRVNSLRRRAHMRRWLGTLIVTSSLAATGCGGDDDGGGGNPEDSGFDSTTPTDGGKDLG